MKKQIFGLALILSLGLSAFANDALTTSMKDMRDGLQSIQDGFSYNNKEGILLGIAQIQQANKIFHDEKSSALYLPKNKQRLARISFLSAHNLNFSLNAMKEYVEMDKIVDASESMSGVVHSCTRCHAIVRGW
jgi:hypothetical protein